VLGRLDRADANSGKNERDCEHDNLPAQERQRLGWVMHARRNCRDYEGLPEVSEAHLTCTHHLDDPAPDPRQRPSTPHP
jgi:hypothetical protein